MLYKNQGVECPPIGLGICRTCPRESPSMLIGKLGHTDSHIASQLCTFTELSQNEESPLIIRKDSRIACPTNIVSELRHEKAGASPPSTQFHEDLPYQDSLSR